MNRTITPLFFLCLMASGAAQSETLPGPIPAELIRVVDGDTIRVRAHIWPDHSVEVMVRLDGIDAPEIHRPDCRDERALAEQAKTEIENITDTSVTLHNVHLGKYAGRVVAQARLPNGVILADHLLKKGLAHTDTSRSSWCQADNK
jgi:endonuclease YncB( thermonuclease family)